jgi:hypothetical protein
MSDELNGSAALVRSLETQIAKLEAENRKLSDEAAKRRHTAKELRAQNEALTKERDEATRSLEALTAENNTLKTNKPDSEKDRIIADLQQQIRTTTHKETFREIAKKANVREDALNDLWDLSGYKAEGDQADEAKLQELITAKLKGRDYLLKPVETTTAAADAAQPNATTNGAQAPITTPATRPGPGATRTTSDTSAPAALSVHQKIDRDFAAYSITGDPGRL